MLFFVVGQSEGEKNRKGFQLTRQTLFAFLLFFKEDMI